MSEQWACSQVVPLVMQFPKQFYFFGFDHFLWRGYILTPPKSKGSPLWVKKRKNCPIVNFDSSKEASWCNECNAKTSGLWKKSRKTFKKKAFFAILAKNSNILRFFLDFFRNGTLERAEVFCVAFSASGRFFWAIKIHYWKIFLFFFHMGDPYDLGGAKMYPHR